MRYVSNLFSPKGDELIYLDNAATSFPKPPAVIAAMVRFQKEVGANAGRSGHRLSIEAGRILFETREGLARLFGIRDSSRVIFGMNATDALNLAIYGVLRAGDHVLTSSMEHNSVMRPLRNLEKAGLQITVLPCSPEGLLDPGDVSRNTRVNTRMCILNHASNVVGTIQPIAEVGRICREKGILFLLDAAQTAGALPFQMADACIDLLAFTGHKALWGPQGTGGLILGAEMDEGRISPIRQGGTGSRSEFEEQPDFLPDRLESGTPNGIGLAGLLAGLNFLQEKGVEEIRRHEMALADRLWRGLSDIPGVTLYGPPNPAHRVAVVSFNLENLTPSEVALRLDEEFGILCRSGLHCAPAAHRTIGTFPGGTVRLSPAYFNTPDEIDAAIQAVAHLAREKPWTHARV